MITSVEWSTSETPEYWTLQFQNSGVSAGLVRGGGGRIHWIQGQDKTESAEMAFVII